MFVNLIFCIIISLVLTALALGLGMYFGVVNKQDIEDLTGIEPPTLPPFLFIDPFEGVSGNNTSKWASSGNVGLSLEIVNACADDWDEHFDEAVNDWDTGTPDALTLTTQKVSYDKKCDFEDGLMKVCNDDYGETGWKGINEYMTSNNIITTSVAKMNEYYLQNANQAERLYTMCHEVGHGFGLAHTDENFLNANLGNCLDYTNMPETNQQPGEVNFQRLADKYGEVPDDRALLVDANDDNAMARVEETALPDWLWKQYSARRLSLSSDNKVDAYLDGWRLINQCEFGAEYEIDLGDGYGARVSMLLV